MRSLQNLMSQAAGDPFTADDVLEYHAARLLMLIQLCGTMDRARHLPKIEGLTKFAKLDFFVRYPSFFQKAAASIGVTVSPVTTTVESRMVRHHYGPWDKRYYQIFAYLEARGLITVEKVGTQYQFTLTETGRKTVEQLLTHRDFDALAEHMKQVKGVLGNKNGNALKTLIYQVFEREIAMQPLGEVIQP